MDIITACASFKANAYANDNERNRVFFNYYFSQLLPDRVVPHGWVVRFAKHGALHPYVLGSKLKADRAQIHELSSLLLLSPV